MSKYSVEQMHQPKSGRRAGRSVDALVDLIGKIMVTEDERFFLVVKFMNRSIHLQKEFDNLVREHYNEVPQYNRRFEWGIKGYSSIIVVINFDEWEIKHQYFNHDTLPTFDLD